MVCAKDQSWGVELYPSMFDAEENLELYKAVLEEELLGVLKYFKGDKSLGPDWWKVELFTNLFDIFKHDLLGMVEESRTKGYIHPHINSTYISLIPKRIPFASFSDFRPISLCNLIYKVISKTVANRMKSTLSKFISPEQFSFLQNRQIYDAVAIAQECMHSIHIKKLNAAIMKVDLQKEYDYLD